MFMIDKKFDTAFKAAQKINKLLVDLYGIMDETYVDLNILVECVRQFADYASIRIRTQSFSALLKNLPALNNSKGSKYSYGAMLSTTEQNGKKDATIVINSDYSPEIQRFSVAHELGHLITEVPNFVYETANDGSFTLSAYTNPDITFLQEQQYLHNNYMVAEQVANIFALLVLIRKDIRIKDLTDLGVQKLSAQYGVTTEAIYSRMLLTNIKPPVVKTTI